jgi:hypothetical protein
MTAALFSYVTNQLGDVADLTDTNGHQNGHQKD